MKKKILIVTKDLESRGGVSSYYRLFFKKYQDDIAEVDSFSIGTKPEDYYNKRFLGIRYFFSYIAMLFKMSKRLLIDRQIQLVQVNPSLIPVPLLRDSIIILVARLFGKRVSVFFRGWREEMADRIAQNVFYQKLFQGFFGGADSILVLAEAFKKSLIRWGIPEEKIFVVKTMFDGSLVEQNPKENKNVPQFLFLSRLCETKGTFEILEAASRLKQEGYPFSIVLAGHGKDLEILDRLQAQVKENGLQDSCSFQGYLEDKEKFLAYRNADIFLLPSWTEGCPNSVLEAMASGLFILATPVGALREVIQDGNQGKFVRVQDASDLYAKMKWCIQNIDAVRDLGKKNIPYAFDHFESKIIINQMKEIYQKTLA